MSVVDYLFSLFKKDPHKYSSKKFDKIINNAIKFLEKSPKLWFPIEKFEGVGIYAIYPLFNIYFKKHINKDYPIYVGKGVPCGWRTARKSNKKNYSLYRRLCEHEKSIEEAINISPLSFAVKYMILNPNLISSVEAELIRKYKPLWNVLINGFGNHNPGINRCNQQVSEWDVLHPGRKWADKMTGTRPSFKEVLEKINKG